MEVVRLATAEEFLAATETYRLADPTRTNVLSSVPMAVAKGDRTYDAYWWWAVFDKSETCVGAAFRTAPFGLQIGPMPLDAARLLAAAVAREDDAFTWVAGSDSVATTFLRAYSDSASPGSTRLFVPGMKSLLYELGDLQMPQVTGSYRVATLDDLELIVRWTHDFLAFTGATRLPDGRDREFTSARVKENSLRLWSVENEPVAMAGHGPSVETPSGSFTRIGPVFTPEDLRGRGFGSAVTAALCQELVARGSRVILYADADYPTSNRVYQGLGFREIDNAVQFDVASTR
jgi:predicted GNAT family acetyltransferase